MQSDLFDLQGRFCRPDAFQHWECVCPPDKKAYWRLPLELYYKRSSIFNTNIAKGTMDPRVEFTESRLSINFKISTKHQNLDSYLKLKSRPNLASEYWPRFNFVNSTKHQQQNTDKTSASKSRQNFNFKISTKVLKVWTKVKLYDQTSAPKSATDCPTRFSVSQWVSDKHSQWSDSGPIKI